MKLPNIASFPAQSFPVSTRPRPAKRAANATTPAGDVTGMELSRDISNCRVQFINGVDNVTLCDQPKGYRRGGRIVSFKTNVNFTQSARNSIDQINNSWYAMGYIPSIPPDIQFLTNNSNLPLNFKLVKTIDCSVNGSSASLEFYTDSESWSDFLSEPWNVNTQDYLANLKPIFAGVTCDSGTKPFVLNTTSVISPSTTAPVATSTVSALSSQGSSGLSVGAMAGIATGVIAGLGILAGVGLYVFMSKRARPSHAPAEGQGQGPWVQLQDITTSAVS